jgi:CheY-like chemotaxis protein
MAEPKRILIVEDDYIIGYDMQSILEEVGLAIIGPVGQPCAAVDLIGRDTPDAAIVDGNLGGEFATGVAACLRARDIPFIFVSGYERDNLPQEFADVPLIRKPFEAEALVAAVKSALRQPA